MDMQLLNEEKPRIWETKTPGSKMKPNSDSNFKFLQYETFMDCDIPEDPKFSPRYKFNI
jgi:hypothetical protein